MQDKQIALLNLSAELGIEVNRLHDLSNSNIRDTKKRILIRDQINTIEYIINNYKKKLYKIDLES